MELKSQPPVSVLSMSDSNFDINNIDIEMRELVSLLRHEGFPTITSCSGGEGHAFPDPTVRFACGGLETAGELMDRLVRRLIDYGYIGFHVSVSYQVSGAVKDNTIHPIFWAPFVEVEFHDLECLKRHANVQLL